MENLDKSYFLFCFEWIFCGKKTHFLTSSTFGSSLSDMVYNELLVWWEIPRNMGYLTNWARKSPAGPCDEYLFGGRSVLAGMSWNKGEHFWLEEDGWVFREWSSHSETHILGLWLLVSLHSAWYNGVLFLNLSFWCFHSTNNKYYPELSVLL